MSTTSMPIITDSFPIIFPIDISKFRAVAIKCLKCNGKGRLSFDDAHLCWECMGKGWYVETEMELREKHEGRS